MHNKLVSFLVSLFAFALISSALSPSSFAQTTNPQVYWGGYLSGTQYGSSFGTAPWDTNTWNLFEQHATKKVSILSFSTPWYNAKGWPQNYVPFIPSLFDSVRAKGEIPFMNWGSWDYNNGPSQPEFSLKNIANGAHYIYKGQTFDAFVTQWARDAKAWGHPFFLRFDWEMNGWWQFPWATAMDPSTHKTLDNNTPADYIAAWRHVHDIFVREGATNVTWVWCPNISGGATVPMSQLYPGDAYVDWTCLDGYNKDFKHWLSFNQVFGGDASYGLKDSYHEILAVAPNKPLLIGETASDEWSLDNGSGVSKAAWIKDALETQLPTNFPKIKALLWFNWNSDAGSSYVIESTLAAQHAFAHGISLPYYATNTFGNISTSPIPPLGGIATTSTATPTPTPTATPGVCLGDINGDGKVNLIDYTILVINFLQNPPSNPHADLNDDGKVDLLDYTILVNNFLRSC